MYIYTRLHAIWFSNPHNCARKYTHTLVPNLQVTIKATINQATTAASNIHLTHTHINARVLYDVS